MSPQTTPLTLRQLTPPLAVQLTYLLSTSQPGALATFLFQYLQGIRSGVLAVLEPPDPEDGPTAQQYKGALPQLATDLASAFPPNTFDSVVSPPSSRVDASPYRAAFLVQHSGARDLTTCFSNPSGTKAGPSGPFDALFGAIQFDSPAIHGTPRSVLIVDDIFKTGNTVAALIRHLMTLAGASNTTFSIACPLWIP